MSQSRKLSSKQCQSTVEALIWNYRLKFWQWKNQTVFNKEFQRPFKPAMLAFNMTSNYAVSLSSTVDMKEEAWHEWLFHYD